MVLLPHVGVFIPHTNSLDQQRQADQDGSDTGTTLVRNERYPQLRKPPEYHEAVIPSVPTASELYDRHGPTLHGTVLRLADGTCAEEAFQEACIELWDAAEKRSQPCSTTRVSQVSVAKARERCTKGGTTPEFERRLSELVAQMRERAVAKWGPLVDPRQRTRRRNEEVKPHALFGNEYP